MTWKYVKEEILIMHRGVVSGEIDKQWLQTHSQLLTYYLDQLSDDTPLDASKCPKYQPCRTDSDDLLPPVNFDFPS